MNRFSALAVLATGVAILVIFNPRISHAQSTYTGTVEKVWEDGFRLPAGDHTLRVDSWNVYGDNTTSGLNVGALITITGEFEGLEFDAFSIADTEIEDTE